MNNYGITRDNLLRTLPDVLKNDKKMCALATVIADLLSGQVDEIRKLKIYSQIDSLPEPLLDILAYDFKVDWYGYDYDIDVKRAQLKDSFNVHRHLGTRGAVERALSAIYPGTEVEEWFDYGGDPYHFRVLLDVTDQRVSISHDEIIRAIDMFKPRRSHLQDNTVIYRSRTQIIIGVTTGYVVYGARLCGTYPIRATQGIITNEDIVIVTHADGKVYTVPKCGETKTGTYPVRATQGYITHEDIVVITDADGTAYTIPKSGEIKTGTHPATATQGGISSNGISLDASGDGVAYSARFCGTHLGSLM